MTYAERRAADAIELEAKMAAFDRVWRAAELAALGKIARLVNQRDAYAALSRSAVAPIIEAA